MGLLKERTYLDRSSVQAKQTEQERIIRDVSYSFATSESLQNGITSVNTEFSSKGGLNILIGTLEKPFECRANNATLSLEAGTTIGVVGFTPFGLSKPKGQIRTAATALCIRDIRLFIEKMDSSDVKPHLQPPRYLFGTTNTVMAQFALNRLGFQALETTRFKKGDIDTQHLIYGEYEKVRQSVLDLKGTVIGNLSVEEALINRAMSQINQPELKLPSIPTTEINLNFSVDGLMQALSDNRTSEESRFRPSVLSIVTLSLVSTTLGISTLMLLSRGAYGMAGASFTFLLLSPVILSLKSRRLHQ